jgi:carbamoyl-phosphate synthase large subunit
LGNLYEERPHLNPTRYAVKTPVFPFQKFKNFDPILGPEMRSTGEVMGLGKSIGSALAKAFQGAGMRLPTKGKVLFSVKDSDKERASATGRSLLALGLELIATEGTADYFNSLGMPCERISKIGRSASGWDLLHVIQQAKVVLVINTPSGANALRDGKHIRQAALMQKIPLVSTLSGAEMVTLAIGECLEKGHLRPIALQDFH